MRKLCTRKLVLGTALAFSFGVLGCAGSPDSSGYTPGVYTASANGYKGPVEVSVTTDKQKIIAVEILSHQETKGVGSRAVDTLPAMIVEAQSLNVDVVSGATASSKAILTATGTALAQAKGQAGTKPVFRAGTYKASAYGNNGYLNVEVDVNRNQILAIRVPDSRETRFLGDTAIERITNDVLQYQTLNVDSVSGATVTSAAFKTALEDALTKSGVDTALLQAAVPPKGHKNVQVTRLNADVIVIGAGGAGLSAAVTVRENDGQVIVIEKMPVIGGNTLRCASAYNTADPVRQSTLPMTDTLKAAVEKALNEKPINKQHAKLIADTKKIYQAYLASGSTSLFDAPEWHALQTYLGGDKVGHVPLIRTYAQNTLPTLDWMQKSQGAPVLDLVSQGAGALWQRTHQLDAPAGTGLVGPLYDRAVQMGVQVITEMKAEKLIVKNGRVVGVQAVDAYGSVYEFMGQKGVILATGGFSNNKELRQKYNPALTPDMVSTNQPGATGDGIVMATAIGADTTGMKYIQVYPLATPGSGALQGRARKMSGLDSVIVVNKEGNRFVNEDARRDEFVAAIKKQTDNIVYDINDSSIVEKYNSFNEDVETLIKLGRIYKADTLAGLEKQLGMPSGNLQKTVDRYNEMVVNKNDPEFGRKLFANQIKDGPFYATPRAPSIHHTMGGLKINSQAQVLNKNGKVVSGLYAAGEVAGGIHGSNRLGGNATADALTFGRIAGKSVMGVLH